jgi:hypothetical protein
MGTLLKARAENGIPIYWNETLGWQCTVQYVNCICELELADMSTKKRCHHPTFFLWREQKTGISAHDLSTCLGTKRTTDFREKSVPKS